MTTYYIEKEGKIVIWDTDKAKLTNTVELMPELKNEKIKKTENVIIDGVIYSLEEVAEKEKEERRKAFMDDFILTSWGWYRKSPKGYANAPQSIDIILNMINALGGLTKQVANLMIFYSEPDFSIPEQCTEEWLVEHQTHPETKTVEEFMEFYIDFQTRWANEQYRLTLGE